MKCIICKGDNIGNSVVKEELKIGDDIVYISIEIPVCSTCGERYYDRRTIQYLENEEKRLKGKKVNLHEVGKVLEYT
ncbi:MAG: YgiT-type zinc finger protein [Candidatus Anammoxibacter sp.]